MAALLVLPLVAHCGSGSSDNASISSTTGQSNMAVGIQLPSGFTYDPATGAISGEFARAGASNPKAYVGQAYITQIDVTRTGGTLASETISLTGTPPQTSASFTVTPGEAYYFSASIYTNQSAPWNVFSGGTLSPVTAPSGGHTASVDIYIPGVNGVPVVTFTADNMNPGSGTANLTCTSSDPDADPVTYLIKTVAPPAGANTLSNSNPTPGAAIAYTTGIASQVDLECVATDSYGAIGYGKLSLNFGTVSVAPTPPTGVTATAGSGQVTISWGASTGATSYNVYWSATPGVTTASNKIAGGSSPYVHAGLTNGAVYYYAVTAVNSVGESGLSAEVSATPTAAVTAPGAPTGVTAVGADSQVTVNWTASAGATSYNIYWSATPGVTTASNKIAGGSSPYVHAGLTNGAVYYYAVTAVNTAGESGLSAEVNATPQAALQPPAPPTGVSAVGANAQVTVSWNASAGATSYNLYWSATPVVTTASTKIAGVTSPYIHTGLTNGTTYSYAVTAVNSAGESGLSVEVNATPALTVTKTADTNDGICDADCSLREAISAANAGAGGETINIPAGTYTITIAGAEEDLNATGDFDIAKNVTITGAGSGSTTINGGALDRMFHVTGAYTVSISGVTITSGGGIAKGGGIYISGAGTVTVTNSTISGNSTSVGGGGGIANDGGGTLTVTNSTITNNAAGGDGGGIYISSGTLTITNSTITNNGAEGGGGGIWKRGATLTVTNSTISGNNSTSLGGGGIYISGAGTVTVTNSTISTNTAGASGGGIWKSGGTLTVTNSTISGNTATGWGGGGIYNYTGLATVTNSTISNNTASWGGGIYINVGTVTVANSTISGNTATGWGGGGIYNYATLTVTNSTISGNSAGGGGPIGGIYNDAATTTLSNTIVANQTAGDDCGGGVTSTGYNLESVATCGFLGVGDLQNTNPLLGALANNGGPTQTMALSVGSPAIDFGSCVTATDQRGIARPQGAGCDIGAYEY